MSIPAARPDGRPHPLAKYRAAIEAEGERRLEERRRPLPPSAEGTITPLPRPGGVGTEIGKLLESFGIGTFAGCSCERLKRDWDAAGVEWCIAHRDVIVAELQANGRRRNWAFGVAAKLAAGPLVDRAIAAVAKPLDTFARVIVISLDRTPDRLRDFQKRFPSAWPFAWPEHFHAIDGDKFAAPDGWKWHKTNRGAVGCWRSWLTILETLIREGVDRPVLIMEDDCQFVDGADLSRATDRIAAAMADVPDDWQILFFGGEHNGKPAPVKPGIVRVSETGRTHCLAIHTRHFADLHAFWSDWKCHVDWGLRRIARERRYYAIDPWCAIQGYNFSTLRGHHEPARSWDSRVSTGLPTLADLFCHAGDRGDVLAALPALRASSRPYGGARLVLYPADFTTQRMNADMVSAFAPLLEAQPYIKAVEFKLKPEGVRLDAWRDRGWPKIYSLADRTLDTLNFGHAERDEPWLTVEPRKVARVVFARSGRYHNPAFPWAGVIEKYGREAVFVGLASEHEAFVKAWGPVPWIETKDYLELAQVIAGAELVVANQSSPFWVAEGLKKRIVQEQAADSGVWNCHHDRPGVTYVLSGDEALPEL